MCKHPNTVIEQAKRDAEHVYKLTNKSGELEGLCLIHNGVLAIAYEVNDNDELDYFAKSSTKGVTNVFELVRRLFGVDEGFIRPLYSVAAC